MGNFSILIYNIAEIVKPSVSCLANYTVKEVAYYIANTYDKYGLE